MRSQTMLKVLERIELLTPEDDREVNARGVGASNI